MQIRVVAVLLACQTALAHADPETPQLTHAEADREDQARLAAEQEQIQNGRLKLRHEQAEAERAKYVEELRAAEFEGTRASRQHRRHVGYAFAGVAAGFGILAIVAAKLGSNTNRDIQAGHFATASDINDRAQLGEIYNYAAEGCGAVAGISALIAVPLITLDLDPGEYRVSSRSPGTVGLSISGRF